MKRNRYCIVVFVLSLHLFFLGKLTADNEVSSSKKDQDQSKYALSNLSHFSIDEVILIMKAIENNKLKDEIGSKYVTLNSKTMNESEIFQVVQAGSYSPFKSFLKYRPLNGPHYFFPAYPQEQPLKLEAQKAVYRLSYGMNRSKSCSPLLAIVGGVSFMVVGIKLFRDVSELIIRDK